MAQKTIADVAKIRLHQNKIRWEDCFDVWEILTEADVPIDAHVVPDKLDSESAYLEDDIQAWQEEMTRDGILPLGQCLFGETPHTDEEIEAHASLRTKADMAEKDYMYQVTMYIARDGLRSDIAVYKSRMRFLKYAWQYVVEYGERT